MKAPPNKKKLQSQASNRRKQNACLSPVHSEVKWGQQLHARALLRSLLLPPCSVLGAGNQHAVLVRLNGEGCPLCYISFEAHPAASKDKHVEIHAFD